MWMCYVCFAMALTLGRSDGPSGQGFSSLRVESLLSKMTLEDKASSTLGRGSFVFAFAARIVGRWLFRLSGDAKINSSDICSLLLSHQHLLATPL